MLIRLPALTAKVAVLPDNTDDRLLCPECFLKQNYNSLIMGRAVLGANLIAFTLLGVLAAAQSDSIPLGDIARAAQRSDPAKPAVRTFDNDSVSSASPGHIQIATSDATDRIRPCNDVVTNQTPAVMAKARDQADDQTGQIKVGQSPEERKKAYEAWHDRITGKEEEVDRLARELYDLETNAPEGVAVLHIWPDDVKYKMMLQQKQEGLDRARAELSDLQEQARRAGVPSYYRD